MRGRGGVRGRGDGGGGMRGREGGVGGGMRGIGYRQERERHYVCASLSSPSTRPLPYCLVCQPAVRGVKIELHHKLCSDILSYIMI